MESTSNPDHGRQSRGLGRFWPVHGTAAPEQRQSDEVEAASSPAAGSDETGSSGAEGSEKGSWAAGSLGAGPLGAGPLGAGSLAGGAGAPVAGSGPTGEQPQVDAVRPAARSGETHMMALGSRRVPEIVNGRSPGQAGFPPADTERDVRAVEPSPRHGGPPIPTVLPLPPSRSPFGAMGPGPEAEADSGTPFRPASSPFERGSPFAPASPNGPRPARGSAGPGLRGAESADASAAARPRTSDRIDTRGPAADAFGASRPDAEDRDRDRDGNATESRAARGSAAAAAPASAPAAAPASAPAAAPASAPASVAAPADKDQGRTGDGAGNRDVERTSGSLRRSSGWAYVPTSGIPTLAATSTPVPGGPTTDDAAAGTPAAGSPPPGPNATSAIPAAGSRRSRDAESQIAAPRRSTTLDDAEQQRPRAGRRAAPDTTDVMGETGGDTDRRPGSDGGDRPADAEETRETQALAGPVDGSADTKANDGAKATAAGVDAVQTTVGGDDAEATPAAPMRPGDVDETLIAFWDDKAIERFRSEWHEVKADFVDDPVAALTRAHDLITEAVDDLTEALLAERDQLDPLRTTSTPDTESMRMAMRGYREFLDRVLAL